MGIRDAIAVFSCAVALIAALAGRASASDEKFLEGLREYRLFRLAEQHCRSRLEDPQLDATQQVALVVELLRTYSEHAMHAPPEERDPLWQQAREVVDGFVAEHARHPRRVLVEVQWALAVLGRGELLRQEAELRGNSEPQLEAAREQIREAVRLLESLDEQLKLERTRQHLGEHELSDDELVSLHQHVRYQLSRAYRNRALCYPAESQDRLAALAVAVEQLEKVLSELPPEDPLAWRCQLDQAMCWRWLGQYEQAVQRISQLEKAPQLPDPLRPEVRAEVVRLLLAMGRLEQAAGFFEQHRGAVEISAEFELAGLEMLLARWHAARNQGETPQVEAVQKQLVEASRELQLRHGAYWGRRADLLLLEALPAEATGEHQELLARAADSLYLKGDLAEAQQTYRRAADAAAQAGQAAEALQLRFKAALIDHQRGNLAEFIAAARQASLEAPQTSTAHLAHFEAIKAAAELARTEPQELERYEALLREHVESWANQETASFAFSWQGRLLESRQAWAEAIQAYQQVPPESPPFAEAVAGAGRCWLAHLNSLKQAGSPLGAEAETAIRFWEGVVAGLADAGGNEAVAARQAALTAARIHLQYRQDGYAAAERLLRRALETSPASEAEWRGKAEALLVWALAGQPSRRAEALERLRQIGQGSPGELLDTIEGLTELARSSPALAQLQLEAIEQLWPQRNSLTAAEQLRLAIARAEALASSGQVEESLRLFSELARQYPDRGDVQIGYARLLVRNGDPQRLKEALAQWRVVANRTAPRTEAWYDAKYQVALLQYQLGEREQAAQLIRYLEATSGLGNPAQAAQFRDLLRRCNSSSSR